MTSSGSREEFRLEMNFLTLKEVRHRNRSPEELCNLHPGTFSKAGWDGLAGDAPGMSRGLD